MENPRNRFNYLQKLSTYKDIYEKLPGKGVFMAIIARPKQDIPSQKLENIGFKVTDLRGIKSKEELDSEQVGLIWSAKRVAESKGEERERVCIILERSLFDNIMTPSPSHMGVQALGFSVVQEGHVIEADKD